MLPGKFFAGLYTGLDEQILIRLGIYSCIEQEVLRPAKKNECSESDAAGQQPV
jgi:hypothetical protein